MAALLEHGADPNRASDVGITPLENARDDPTATALLIEYGATTNGP